MTRDPKYLYYYNTSFPELYKESKPDYYASQLKAPTIGRLPPDRTSPTDPALSLISQTPGPGTYFNPSGKETIIRKNVAENKAKAMGARLASLRHREEAETSLTSPSIEKNNKNYRIFVHKKDILVVEVEGPVSHSVHSSIIEGGARKL